MSDLQIWACILLGFWLAWYAINSWFRLKAMSGAAGEALRAAQAFEDEQHAGNGTKVG